MSPAVENLKLQVDGLTEEERAELAQYLLSSLDLEPEEYSDEEAWKQEMLRRLEDMRSGRVEGIPGEQVMAKMRELFP